MYGLYSRAACNQERLMMALVRYVLILNFSAAFRHFFSLMKGFEAVPANLPLSVTAIDGSLIKTSTTTMQISKWRENSTRILGPGKKQNFRKLDCSNLIKKCEFTHLCLNYRKIALVETASVETKSVAGLQLKS